MGVLIQTINLKKMKSITSAYVYQLRQEHLQKTYDEMNATNKRKRALMQICDKLRYVGRLPLVNIVEEDDVVDSKDSERVPSVEKLSCDPRWPVCTFDHARKSLCATYFCFRTADPLESIEDYFSAELPNLTENGYNIRRSRSAYTSAPRPVPMLSEGPYLLPLAPTKSVTGESTAAMEAKPFATLQIPASPQPEAEETKLNPKQREELYGSLLVERNRHYCQDSVFVSKLNTALKMEIAAHDAFPLDLIDPPVGEEALQIGLMEKYMKHVSSCTLPPTAEERKENRVERKTSTKDEIDDMNKKLVPLGVFLENVLRKVGRDEECIKSSPSGQFLEGILLSGRKKSDAKGFSSCAESGVSEG